jgi:magnesium chelatase family protein
VCVLDDSGKGLLRAAMQQLHLSARAYHRILNLARTIANLAWAEGIETPHLAEANQDRGGRGLDVATLACYTLRVGSKAAG